MCNIVFIFRVILEKPIVLNTNTIGMVYGNFVCIPNIPNMLVINIQWIEKWILRVGVFLLLLFKQNYICFTTKRKSENILSRLCLERVCLCNIPVNSFGHIEMVS